MARSSARLRDGERLPALPRRAAKPADQPRSLTREDLELPDGRYLLAYGQADPVVANA